MPTLSIPAYILHADVQNKPVAHAWRGAADFTRENDKLAQQLTTLSLRARLACAAATAEWIYWRLRGETDFDAPLQMIEAAWAANCDVRYCQTPTVSEFEDRKGPVNGVLRASKDILANVLRSYKAESAGSLTSRTVYLYFLARHVLPDKVAFDAWLKAAIKRLALLYPHVEGQLGEPVPREAMNTEEDFQKADAPRLLAEFLGRLTPAENRYLRSPEQVLAEGFAGTPYRLS
jgi:hypothetical protein